MGSFGHDCMSVQVTWRGSPRSQRSLPVPFKEVQRSWGQKRPRKYFCSTEDIKSLFSRPPGPTLFIHGGIFLKAAFFGNVSLSSSFCCVFLRTLTSFTAQICRFWWITDTLTENPVLRKADSDQFWWSSECLTSTVWWLCSALFRLSVRRWNYISAEDGQINNIWFHSPWISSLCVSVVSFTFIGAIMSTFKDHHFL